ncbi:MAG: hypothetical protein HQK83_15525, partial [Fibrobacteria bacterium]|nr:hypothetical protein [Fibrobacteria bacterium]
IDESLSLADPSTNAVPGRTSTAVQVCVQDQVFSGASIDTVLLDKIECASSGDQLNDVVLVQTAPAEGIYCATVRKQESVSGALTDDILHCQDIDNIIAVYQDPVYGTEATGQVTIIDPTKTTISVVDVAGNPVSSWSEADGGKLKVRLTAKSPGLYKPDTLKVKLESDSGDSLLVLVYETAVHSGVFEGTFFIGFSSDLNLRNKVLEGRFDTASAYNTMSITATWGTVNTSVTVNAAYVPVKRAWIVDGNSDGQGDSIYISFSRTITELPGEITSIDWNSEGMQEHRALYNNLDPIGREIGYVRGSFSSIAVVLSGVMDRENALFPANTTGIDLSNPPTLELPSGSLFRGQEVLLEDGMGAVVVSAEKLPSDNSYYTDAEGNLQQQPDTLVITLSEKLRPLHDAGVSWDSLFKFRGPGMTTENAYPLISLPGSRPEVKGPDSLVWTFIVDNNSEIIKPLVDDELFLNSSAPYADASLVANAPRSRLQVITGADNPNPITNSNIFVPVMGPGLNDPNSMVVNLYVDKQGNVMPGRGAVLVQDQSGTSSYERVWVPPFGLKKNGTVLSPDATCMSGAAESAAQEAYPDNCLSSVQVFSTESYVAEISIFDHLGIFIHQSVQYFGQCGELENKNRRTPQGFMSWLVWNQEDLQGQYVGTGVYIWKIKFTTSAGQYTEVYRQGIVRVGSDPEEGCVK